MEILLAIPCGIFLIILGIWFRKRQVATRFKDTAVAVKINGEKVKERLHPGISSLKSGTGIWFLSDYFDCIVICLGIFMVIIGSSYFLGLSKYTKSISVIINLSLLTVISVLFIIYNILVNLVGRKKDLIKLCATVENVYESNKNMHIYKMKLYFKVDGQDAYYEPIISYKKKKAPAVGTELEILYSKKYKRVMMKEERHKRRFRVFIGMLMILVYSFTLAKII